MAIHVVNSLLVNVVALAVLLLVSGRMDWIRAWLYVAIMGCLQIAVVLLVFRKNPDLARERSKIQPGTKLWDKIIVAGATVLAPLAMYLVAALDVRFAWAPPVPPGLTLAGFAICAAGGLLTFLAMRENRFFSTFVRIQTDRGHTVVDAGPYRHIRHPGYTGMIAFDLGTPFALGSYCALIPAAVAAGLFLLRTGLEDRTLRAELPGYSGYAARVRKRLLPYVW
jgi:protein-S-isoprenylcysteine O-methyltransferase Ste14